MKVLDSKVIVQVIKDEACTKIGEFVIPESNKEYDTAKVIAVGPNVAGLEEGETVYIYLNAGKEVKINDSKYRVITTNEIIVVL